MVRYRSTSANVVLNVVWASISPNFSMRGVLDCFGEIASKVPVVAATDFRSRAGEYGIKVNHSHTPECRAIQLSICLRIAWIIILNLIDRWLITK